MSFVLLDPFVAMEICCHTSRFHYHM